MHYSAPNSDNFSALTTAGVVVPAALTTSSAPGVTLTAATFYVPLGSVDAPGTAEASLVHVHLKWAAAVAGTITVETCSFGRDVTDFDATAGGWIQENPAGAVVAVVGTGNTATNLTVTAGGTNAGGCSMHLGNLGSRRIRLKIVATAGGVMRIGANSKIGG